MFNKGQGKETFYCKSIFYALKPQTLVTCDKHNSVTNEKIIINIFFNT